MNDKLIIELSVKRDAIQNTIIELENAVVEAAADKDPAKAKSLLTALSAAHFRLFTTMVELNDAIFAKPEKKSILKKLIKK